MKRFTGALLSVCLLAALCFPAAAFAPAADTALTPLTALPEGSEPHDRQRRKFPHPYDGYRLEVRSCAASRSGCMRKR